MRTYTVHLPRGAAPGDAAVVERAILVRDGFNWAAFFFSVLWMLWHRLWLAALATFVVVVAVSVALEALPVGDGVAVLASLLVALLIGLEASSLRRWTYARRGMPMVDVVAAPSYDEADALACARLVARSSESGRTPPPPPAVVPPPPPSAPVPARPSAEIVPFGLRPEGAP
ncbi:DUF2628 domain-containing protein [Salinarimonas rosea]|uniref:DUF2628 domain-containing protein n=1 Tax=Salinarimonas rosea TaxID=552063 RepID=UPI0004130B37|nr:DUF2628 domain-containing protein [Salinarimonas rosea]